MREATDTPILSSEVAEELGGELYGDPQQLIALLCPLEGLEPQGLAFFSGKSASKLTRSIGDLKECTILTVAELAEKASSETGATVIAVSNPQVAFLELIPKFYSAPRPEAGLDPLAFISPTARIGANVAVLPFSWISDSVEIGDNTIVYPHVAIYPHARIGANCIIHSGAVVREHCVVDDHSIVQNGAIVGADGFGYIPDPKLGLRAVPQIGTARLGQRVEVGANACVDRGAIGDTIIGDGSKLDNMVQIGHNSQVGQHSVLCGQVALAGSVKVGNGVTIAGQAGVADHVSITDGVRVGSGSGVTRSINEPGDYLGFPAVEASKWRRQQVALRKLPGLLKKFFKQEDK